MKRLSVYIAGSSSEIARAKRAADELARLGIEVTSTWWHSVETVGLANPADAPRPLRQSWSLRCLDELSRADAMWLQMPAGYSHGAFAELGYALKAEKPVVVSGDSARSIFCALVTEKATDADAIRWLLSLAADMAKLDEYSLGEVK